MNTVKDLFERDLSNFFTQGLILNFNDNNKNPLPSAILKVCFDINNNTRLVKSYIPETPHYAEYIDLIYKTDYVQKCDLGKDDISRRKKIRVEGIGLEKPLELNSPDGGFDVLSGHQGFGDHQKLSDTQFNKRVFIYVEKYIEKNKRDFLLELGQKAGLYPVIRDKNYLDATTKDRSPLAFISHDSRDKEVLVSDLALKLTQRFCPVWYDDFSLGVGDNLRKSIEKGLRETKYCILVLSPNFLNNKGWGEAEFESIFAKNIDSDENLILPIWHNVNKNQVKEFCLSLSNIVALMSDDPLLVDKLISKIKNN